MKRNIFILCLSIISLTTFAQRGPGSEPGLLEFKHTTFVEGATKPELEEKATAWMKSVGHLVEPPFITLEDGREKNHSVYRLMYAFSNKFRLGEETNVFFMVDIYCKDGLYIVTVYDIDTAGFPYIYKYYGENGALYPELYTKRQLKQSVPVIEFIMDRADEIFKEIDNYILN